MRIETRVQAVLSRQRERWLGRAIAGNLIFMNLVLQEILDTRQVLLPSGDRVAVSSHIDPACGALLQRAIRDVQPSVAVEVGLAFGISTLYILESLAETGSRKLIGIDPAQNDSTWCGGGLHNIERAGYRDLYEFYQDTSQQVLPMLVARGERIGFGFIDGWHTFDHALLDFFYIDQMLDIGGIVVFDDVGYPAIRRLCEFVVVNRSYEIYDSVKYEKRARLRRTAKQLVREVLLPLYKTDQTPSRPMRNRIAALGDVYFLALRKTAKDYRRWDHFVHF